MRTGWAASLFLRSSKISLSPQCPFLHHRPRHFHQSFVRRRRKPAHLSISQAELERRGKERAAAFQAYTPEEKAELAKRYTPAQLEAIEAGEAAIAVNDLATQARPRNDTFLLPYLDDFSRIEPLIDKRASKLRGEGEDYENVTDFANVPSPDDLMERVGDVLLEGKGGIDFDDEGNPIVEEPEDDLFASMWQQATKDADSVPINAGLREAFEDDSEEKEIDVDDAIEAIETDMRRQRETIVPTAEDAKTPAEKIHESSLAKINAIFSAYDNHPDPPDVAPDMPKIEDPSVRFSSAADADQGAVDEETARAYVRLSQQMGQPVEQLRRYRVKTLVSHRVVNQTRLGKIQTIYYLCVAGNEKGLVGLGEGKAAEADEGRRSARLAAIRNMKPVRRYENRTIFGEVKGKVSGVELKLSARPPGFGLRCSQHIFEIARCAGILDLSAKVTRSRNPMNVAKATWQALLSQRDPEDIARARGRKLVDVRKVYYSGLV